MCVTVSCFSNLHIHVHFTFQAKCPKGITPKQKCISKEAGQMWITAAYTSSLQRQWNVKKPLFVSKVHLMWESATHMTKVTGIPLVRMVKSLFYAKCEVLWQYLVLCSMMIFLVVNSWQVSRCRALMFFICVHESYCCVQGLSISQIYAWEPLQYFGNRISITTIFPFSFCQNNVHRREPILHNTLNIRSILAGHTHNA